MAADLAFGCPLVTDGEIAIANLESARQRSWSRFSENPHQPGVAELIVEQESQVIQFLGDVAALDRLEMLATQLVHTDVAPARRGLIQAQVASIGHRFADARSYLVAAEDAGAEPDAVRRLTGNIDQACGARLGELLDARHATAAKADRLEELLPLGALLIELAEFDEADDVLRRALRVYSDVSPFAVALVCFQLGVLWGEAVPEPQALVAAEWYRKAINYVPAYTKARVHLAEILSSCSRLAEATALLSPFIASPDPEVRWRLADCLSAAGADAEAAVHLQAARSMFEELLQRHLLAFADHGAEFFAGSGDDPRRALELARVNLATRPTLRAFESAYAIAVSAGDTTAAFSLLANARKHWGETSAFQKSPLACHDGNGLEGAGTR